jgi:hypothetical protein
MKIGLKELSLSSYRCLSVKDYKLLEGDVDE